MDTILVSIIFFYLRLAQCNKDHRSSFCFLVQVTFDRIDDVFFVVQFSIVDDVHDTFFHFGDQVFCLLPGR